MRVSRSMKSKGPLTILCWVSSLTFLIRSKESDAMLLKGQQREQILITRRKRFLGNGCYLTRITRFRSMWLGSEFLISTSRMNLFIIRSNFKESTKEWLLKILFLISDGTFRRKTSKIQKNLQFLSRSTLGTSKIQIITNCLLFRRMVKNVLVCWSSKKS